MAPEPYMTIPKLAEKVGIPASFIRAACNRGKEFHPLPCLKVGEKRPIYRIKISEFEKWAAEEAAR